MQTREHRPTLYENIRLQQRHSPSDSSKCGRGRLETHVLLAANFSFSSLISFRLDVGGYCHWKVECWSFQLERILFGEVSRVMILCLNLLLLGGLVCILIRLGSVS